MSRQDRLILNWIHQEVDRPALLIQQSNFVLDFDWPLYPFSGNHESLGGLAQPSVAHGEALGKVGQGWLGLKGKPLSEGQVWAGSICETWRAGLNTAVG